MMNGGPCDALDALGAASIQYRVAVGPQAKRKVLPSSSPHLPLCRACQNAFPWPLRLLLSTRPEAVTRVLAIVTRAIETALIRRAGKTRKSGARGGIVTLTYPARFNASGVP